jgi:type 1 fimbriae regulatory protein FimB/type 1 fimbriae regulatory protein FimE
MTNDDTSSLVLPNRRRYLTPAEIDALIDAARGRHKGRRADAASARNATMIALAYRHALRVSELITMQWSAVDLTLGTLHVTRLKNGIDTVHPLTALELRMLKRLRRNEPHARFVFLTSRQTPMTRQNFAHLLNKLGKEANIEVPVTPHMLRHSTGYKLANQGTDTRTIQHYLGHRNIQHTVRYTHLNANRFNGLFRD